MAAKNSFSTLTKVAILFVRQIDAFKARCSGSAKKMTNCFTELYIGSIYKKIEPGSIRWCSSLEKGSLSSGVRQYY